MVIAAMKLKDAYSLEGKLWPTYGGEGGGEMERERESSF